MKTYYFGTLVEDENKELAFFGEEKYIVKGIYDNEGDEFLFLSKEDVEEFEEKFNTTIEKADPYDEEMSEFIYARAQNLWKCINNFRDSTNYSYYNLDDLEKLCEEGVLLYQDSFLEVDLTELEYITSIFYSPAYGEYYEIEELYEIVAEEIKFSYGEGSLDHTSVFKTGEGTIFTVNFISCEGYSDYFDEEKTDIDVLLKEAYEVYTKKE